MLWAATPDDHPGPPPPQFESGTTWVELVAGIDTGDPAAPGIPVSYLAAG